MTITLSSTSEHELRATVRSGDQAFEWYVRSPVAQLQMSGEYVAAGMLLPAMARHETLQLPRRVSSTFEASLGLIQDAFAFWFPELKRVDVVSDEPAPVAHHSAKDGRVASFFSGGVDSFYTALRRGEELDALVFVHGFDVPLENETSGGV